MAFVEPVEGYLRNKPSSKMPLSRAPDIAAPDALPARKFNLLVDDYLKERDPAKEQLIKEYLLNWIDNDKNLKVLGRENYAVREFLPLSAELSKASVIGMQALSENVDHDADWKNKALNILAIAEKPHSECEIKVIAGLKLLLKSAN